MRKLLVGRTFWGFGDWLMMSSVFRMINRYRPDVEIDLLADPRAPRRLLYLPQLLGARYALVTDTDPAHYDWYIPHLVYKEGRPIGDTHLMQGMVQALNAQCPGINVPYDREMLAKPVLVDSVPVPNRCVLLPSCGWPAEFVGQIAHRAQKEWQGFDELGHMLANEGYNIVQVGSRADPLLTCARARYLDVPYEQLASVYYQAEFSVAIENGLSHWAGHLGTRCYTLYFSHYHARSPHTWYPGQIPIESDSPPTVKAVYGSMQFGAVRTPGSQSVIEVL